jgi:RNA polymerase sigma factor (sigma-70 family)
VAEFCRTHRFSQSYIGNLINLKDIPYDRRNGRKGRLTDTALRLCDLSGLSGDELFPAQLYAGVIPPMLAAEVSSGQFLPLSEARGLLSAPAQEDAIYQDELKAQIAKSLNTLTPREEMVVSMRHGLDGEGERTLADIGAAIGVGRERAYQIEQKAYRKLRHSSRAGKLHPFVAGAQ